MTDMRLAVGCGGAIVERELLSSLVFPNRFTEYIVLLPVLGYLFFALGKVERSIHFFKH